MKNGITLIVLIIVCVTIIILGTAIIVNLAQSNIIENANKAIIKHDFKIMQEELNMYIANEYVKQNRELDVNAISAVTETEKKHILKSSLKSKYIEWFVIQNGEITILDTMPEPQSTWAMEALNIAKILSSEDMPEDTIKYNYIKTGLQCYLDSTNKKNFVGSVWNDISGNSNNAILNGCTYSDGKLVFDGVDDWANLGKHHYPNYTYEIVLECNESREAHIIGNWESGGGGIGIDTEGLIYASSYINDSYEKLTLDEKLNLNTKYKITYTSNGNECKVYINGGLMKSLKPGDIIEMPDLQTITAVGVNPVKNTAYGEKFLKGNVYLVRIYDRVLSEQEVKQNYNYDNEKIAINDTIYENLEIADSLYEITSLEKLQEFRDAVNSGNSFEDKYVELKTDIDMATISSWIPIGTETNKFKGVFNGNNHSVSNITVDNSSSYQGLFGNNAGIIENISIKSGTIRGTQNVGAIAGNNTGIISNCVNKSYVETTENASGGICGNNAGTIQKSYNYGNITTTGNSVAGIAGENYGDIKFCGNNATITGSNSSSYYVGGIVGILAGSAKVSSCYNTGEITCNGGNNKNNSHTGGIIGGLGGSNIKVKIEYCYNTGNVTGTGCLVGGIVGYVAETVKTFNLNYCYNIGTITSKGGNASNNSYAGGIVGYANSSDSKIKYCYNVGSVKCTAGTKYPGGIVGFNEGSVSYCYLLSTLGLDIISRGTSASSSKELTDSNMKVSSFVTNLGGSTYWYLDGSYPKLMWEQNI